MTRRPTGWLLKYRNLDKILAFTALVEAGTGLALLGDPGLVVRLLLGVEAGGIGALLGRFFGIALVALALACWPGRERAEGGSSAARAMLAYNLLVALYLTYLGGSQPGGVLLWPAVALHGVIALCLVWPWSDKHRALENRR